MQERLSHVVGFDDAPFARPHRGDVLVVGAVFAGMRLDGVISTRVRRDGANATARLVECVLDSPFAPQLHAILLQGITLAGFNVVDLPALHARTGLPILAVARHAPDLPAIRRALLGPVPGGVRKWRLIEAAGVMEPLAGLYVQRCGLSPEAAQRLLEDQRVHSRLPEPLRVAHLIAGGVATGASRHRP
ncbi:DUF99 family protein [Thioalkalivibrio sp. ALMg13-2]|uniref:endonuclease dU n=1 Tax=Thioalkalivibrio sp. ALMg13-2 TaxID=1158167 RepID=UPI000360EE27|nr:DUF99 family protein [Thioalkalivibrio sp. ALMg13-2]